MPFGETTSREIERVAREIVDAAFKIHSKFGAGLLESAYLAQLLTYLKFTGCRLGILINFNTKLIKDGIKRVIL